MENYFITLEGKGYKLYYFSIVKDFLREGAKMAEE